MASKSTKNLVFSGVLIALGILLPFITAQIPEVGQKLLPMHIPVLLAGFLCGAPYGLAVGFITPLLRSLMFTMPPMYPVAVAMAFELAAYGFFTGFFNKILPKKDLYIYPNLVISMILGRVIWGGAMLILMGVKGNAFGWKMFINGAVLNAIPGIVLQLILIPVIVIALRKGRVIDSGY